MARNIKLLVSLRRGGFQGNGSLVQQDEEVKSNKNQAHSEQSKRWLTGKANDQPDLISLSRNLTSTRLLRPSRRTARLYQGYD